MKLSHYLQGYQAKFSINLDALWSEYDKSNNGYLDRAKSLKFLKELARNIEDQDRARNFDSGSFNQLFNKFDENQNGLLEKSEMAILIKKVFAKTKTDAKREDAISKERQNLNLA